MKRIISIIIGSVILSVSLVALGFTLKQIQEERTAITTNLQQRASLLADSLKESIEPYYASNSLSSLQKIVDRFANKERLVGIVLYDNKGSLVAASSGLPQSIIANQTLASKVMDSDTSEGDFVTADNEARYVLVDPLHNDASVVGALVVVQNAGYLSTNIKDIWIRNLLRLAIQIGLFSVTIFLILRFLVFRQILRFVESVRRVRTSGENDGFGAGEEHSLFKPLASEIGHMSKSLTQARSAASEEARMRLEKLDSPWTAERLKEFIKATIKDRPIFVASNREPYIHERTKNGITYHVPAGGVVTALEPVMEACGGTWIAHGSGSADKDVVDAEAKIMVPPIDPKYTLKRVWLTEEEVNGYYVGFSNEALWPLLHMAHTRPIFREDDWLEYRKVNGKFAETILAEIKNVANPIVFIQDFHLSLVPYMVKKSRPDAQIGIFWHIPWLSAEAFSICPWRKEIIEGILGADVVGFHTQQFCNNFIETVSKNIESVADFDQFCVTHQGHTTYIKSFPISIDFTGSSKHQFSEKKGRAYLKKLGIHTKYLGLGVDRMDYTKGILERFKAVEFFFDNYPEYKNEFTFLQIAAPSRENVPKYKEFAEEVAREAQRINQKFKKNGWEPIVLLQQHHSHDAIGPLYRVADVCMVTSLHDGMNLVAKEYVSARSTETGVLILSQFTGAAKDVQGAIIINPYSAVETSEALHLALTMSLPEQYKRMKKMRESVKNYNIYRWSAEFLKTIVSLG